MKVRFWGTRGSIAQSGFQVLKYGGNTSCVEIRSEANDLIVLDAGTGLHGLSQQLLKEKVQLQSASILYLILTGTIFKVYHFLLRSFSQMLNGIFMDHQHLVRI